MSYTINPLSHVFYINLDDNLHRNKQIKNILLLYGFTNITRIPAVDTRKIDNIELVKNFIEPNAYYTLIKNITIKRRKSHRELTKGAVGCYLSHLKIYNKIVEQNIPYAIIFEDDCKFVDSPDNFWIKMNSIQIPTDAHIFLFDAIIHEFNIYNCPYINVCQVNFFFCTHFYLITLMGAKIALANLLPIECQIDSKLSMLAYANIINIYAYNGNKFAKQDNNFQTNIQLLTCPSCDVYKEINDMKTIINKNNREKNKIYYTTLGISICTSAFILIILIIILIILLFYINKNNK